VHFFGDVYLLDMYNIRMSSRLRSEWTDEKCIIISFFWKNIIIYAT